MKPFLILAALLLSQVAFASGVAKHVVLISIDGGKARTVQKTDLPVIHGMASAGAASWLAQTISYSRTIPSHASMISGVDMDVHKMTWNDYDPRRPMIQVPTIFSEAKKAGLKTALFTAKPKFQHFNPPGILDHFELVAEPAEDVAWAAAAYFRKEKPNILMIHFADADAAGHASGWDSPAFIKALKDVNKAIGIVEKAIANAGLDSSTLVIITADHGGTGNDHGQDIPEHREIPWIAFGAGVRPRVALSSKISTMDTAATILWALGLRAPAGWQGKVVSEAFR